LALTESRKENESTNHERRMKIKLEWELVEFRMLHIILLQTNKIKIKDFPFHLFKNKSLSLSIWELKNEIENRCGLLKADWFTYPAEASAIHEDPKQNQGQGRNQEDACQEHGKCKPNFTCHPNALLFFVPVIHKIISWTRNYQIFCQFHLKNPSKSLNLSCKVNFQTQFCQKYRGGIKRTVQLL